MFGLGELPAGYNKKIHGPYDPAIFYGKKDTPLGEVKLGQLPGWLARRSKNPVDWGRACSRFYWRWSHRWVQPKYAGLAGYVQLIFCTSGFFYLLNYQKLSHHKNQKYHW